MGNSNHVILDLDVGTIQTSEEREKRRQRFRFLRLLGRTGFFVIKWATLFALPFLLLVKGSVWAYQGMGWGTWPSLMAGVTATLLIFLIYVSRLWKRVSGRKRTPKLLLRAVTALVVGYAGYGLLYLSAANAKTPEIREYFTSLHPIMRLGASTFLLFDRDAVITDTQRTTEDYVRMGLPVNETSLHFKVDGRWVHALDLRTLGRPEWRNRLTAGYFAFMGFRTLRHTGTADHLHISLPPRTETSQPGVGSNPEPPTP